MGYENRVSEPTVTYGPILISCSSDRPLLSLGQLNIFAYCAATMADAALTSSGSKSYATKYDPLLNTKRLVSCEYPFCYVK